MMVQKLDNVMWRVYERPLNDVINVTVVGWSYSCRRGAAGTFTELTVRSYFKMPATNTKHGKSVCVIC